MVRGLTPPATGYRPVGADTSQAPFPTPSIACMVRRMTERERILAILAGDKPDRMPWIPRLEIWYRAHRKQNTLPEPYQDMSLRQLERALGCGTPARGGKIVEKRYENVEVVTTREERFRTTEYRTPVGTVREMMRFSDDLSRLGLPGLVVENVLKQPADYKVWTYVVENTHWDPCFDTYDQYDREIGDDGLPMTAIGDVPFHQFARELAGYENAYCHLADWPAEVEALLETITAVFAERLLPIVLASPAKLLLHGGHLSSQFTPPPIFRKYILPHCRRFFDEIHAAGKLLTMHADNDTSAILDELAEGDWDLMECFATAPLVPTTLQQALDAWGGRPVIWGGVPSTLFGPACPQDQFERHVADILATVAGRRDVILGIADNLMPDADIERVEYISRALGLM